MPDQTCTVCGNPGTRSIGGRRFCEKHFSSARRVRKHAWRDQAFLLVGLLLFVGLVFVLDGILKPVFSGSSLVWAGVILALVPAGIWMVFFYWQDRLEPEPKGYILAVALLGGMLAAAIGIPLIENVFRVSKWLYADTLTTILGSILVIGFIQESLKFFGVRFSVFSSLEFDEATDGVIYGTAAGLGYATMLNIQFVVSNGGVGLGASVIHMAVVALAQASFSAISGYFLGRSKFEKHSFLWLPSGLALAAVANGIFNWLRGLVVQNRISLGGSGSNPWMGLLLAAVFSLATTGIILWLVQRNTKATLAKEQEQA